MNRRDLLRLLLATPLALTVDVEKLLWIPKPIITVPSLPVTNLFYSDDWFYFQLQKKCIPISSSRPMRIPLEIRPQGIFKQLGPIEEVKGY